MTCGTTHDYSSLGVMVGVQCSTMHHSDDFPLWDRLGNANMRLTITRFVAQTEPAILTPPYIIALPTITDQQGLDLSRSSTKIPEPSFPQLRHVTPHSLLCRVSGRRVHVLDPLLPEPCPPASELVPPRVAFRVVSCSGLEHGFWSRAPCRPSYPTKRTSVTTSKPG